MWASRLGTVAIFLSEDDMALAKIEKLTKKQEDSLVRYRNEWLAYGRSCDPADRKTCKRVFSEMYKSLGHKEPYIWWCDGPAVGSMVRTVLKSNNLRDNLRDNLRANLWDNLRANLWANLGDNLGANLRDNLRANLRANLGDNLGANLRDNLRDNLRANLWDNLGANLRANLWDNLRANLGDNLGANLGANLRDNLRDNLRANLRANLWDNLWDNLGDNLGANLRDNLRDNLWANISWYFWGQHECYWPVYYNWPHHQLRPMHNEEQVKKLTWWLELSKSCGWWEPFKGIVFVCERPERQLVDERGRLHCQDGPAILCRDGWPVHAVHGIRVPGDIVEDRSSVTIGRIEEEKNAEVRRVMIEMYGFDSYIKDAKIKQIQHDDFGRLYRKEIQGEPAMQFVRVVNSTAEPDGSFKEYCIPVRNTVKTAHEAVASSFGIDVASYAPSFES